MHDATAYTSQGTQPTMATLSKTQIDRLGDRLRKGSPSEADLRLLDEYRLSFGDAYDAIIRTIREKLQLEPTGRPDKTPSSIVEKLRRESIRLSQCQDIAGCRIIVPDVFTQDHITATLRDTFPETRVMDRRKNPSHGPPRPLGRAFGAPLRRGRLKHQIRRWRPRGSAMAVVDI